MRDGGRSQREGQRAATYVPQHDHDPGDVESVDRDSPEADGHAGVLPAPNVANVEHDSLGEEPEGLIEEQEQRGLHGREAEYEHIREVCASTSATGAESILLVP